MKKFFLFAMFTAVLCVSTLNVKATEPTKPQPGHEITIPAK